MNPEIRQLIMDQKDGLKESYDIIKKIQETAGSLTI